ncbi:PTS sugar transporter subunit IIA [Enterococcus sp. DIV0187]|uniref:PTS sugar transporter subunit IIA n=1 Tax=Enterococcus sp. DIV0187 TaxID=2774644 RepID=UPI003F239CD2
MIGVLLVSHSKLAHGMKAAIEFVAGEQKNLFSLGLEETGIAPYRAELENLVANLSEDIKQMIIVCDIPAGSPGTNAYDILTQTDLDIEMLSGMNLAMLLDMILMREGKEFHQLIADGIKAGKESIDRMDFSEDEDEEEF